MSQRMWCYCDKHLDPCSLHELSCQLNAGHISCYKINLNIKWTLARVNISSTLESVGLSKDDQKGSIRFSYCSEVRSKWLVFDVTICRPYAPLHVLNAVAKVGITTSWAERSKALNHQDLWVRCWITGKIFCFVSIMPHWNTSWCLGDNLISWNGH